MARLPDELSPRIAADRLGIHINTIYRWIDLVRAGVPTRLRRGDVRTDLTGHHWLKKPAVDALAKSS